MNPDKITKTMQRYLSDNGYELWFQQWMEDNWSIWRDFHSRASELQRAGQLHYSAMTLVGVIRYETDLREKHGHFKIRNEAAPRMARLYNELSKTEFFRRKNKETS